MEFKIYDKMAKIYEIKMKNDPPNARKKIKFFTNYNLVKKLSHLDFIEDLIVFSVQKIVLIIRVNQFLQTIEIHKCDINKIEESIKNNKQYNVISSFMIDSIESKIEQSFTPFFLDSQYFCFIINQEVIQYNLASLLTSENTRAFALKQIFFEFPNYLGEDFIYFLYQSKLYQIQRHGYQKIHLQSFIFNMASKDLENAFSQSIKFYLNVSIFIDKQNDYLLQNPFINSVTFETNKITLEIYLPFQNYLIKQYYSMIDHSEFIFVNENIEEVNFDQEPGLIQIWNINQVYDQQYSLIFS